MNTLSADEQERYAAHIALCEIDLPGQQRIRSARVLVVGAGALASPALLYLAAAGVGHIGVMDGDRVSLSNLQRQIIHCTGSIGKPKTESAQDALLGLNPGVNVMQHRAMITADNAAAVIAPYDLVLDCTDNYVSRRLISDTCVALGKPLCFAALSRFQGQVFTHVPGTAAYADFFPTPPTEEQLSCTSCAVTGVLNAMAGICGSIQAAEALKYITGTGDLLTDRMLLIDAIDFKFTTIKISR